MPGRGSVNLTEITVPLTAASVADLDDDGTGIVYLEAIARPQTIEDSEVVSQVRLTVNALRAEAQPRGTSRELITKVAEERWT